ncbi:MAG: protein O-mannosyl-transferase family [Anaerolineae bacterium]
MGRRPGHFTLLCISSAVTFTALLIYSITLAPGLTWANFGGDGGELVTAAVTLGVPHPPGYPTYILLGKLFSFLPMGTAAFRLNLMSAVAAASAAGVVSATALIWLKQAQRPSEGLTTHLAAASAGLAFAFVPAVWSQAVIAEVYTLNLLFLALFLFLLLTHQRPMLTGFFLGLSITTHLTSLLVLPLALILSPAGRRRRLLPGMLLGLTPFLLIPWLAGRDSPVIWGNPATWHGFWWLVSGRIYWNNALSLPVADLGPRLWRWGTAMLRHLTWIWLPLIIAGYEAMPNETRRRARLMALTASGAFVYTIGYNTADAQVLILPAVLLLTLLLAWGLSQMGWLAPLLPLTLLLLNFNQQDLSKTQQARPLIQSLLAEVPQDAVLITSGNQIIFPLWYFQHVEGLRPDVVLVDADLFAFDWYRQRLGQQQPELTTLAADNLPAFKQENRRLHVVCEATLKGGTQPVQPIVKCLQRAD